MIFQEKKSKKASVLSRQKPKRAGRGKKKKKSGAGWSKWKIGGAVLVLAAIVAGGVFAKKKLSGWLAQRAAPLAWDVTLKTDDARALPTELAQKVRETAVKNLGAGSADELGRTAAAIQKLEAFARVSVVRVARSEAVVEVRARRPMLCVRADQVRFVGELGEVYGLVPSGAEASCPSPVLTGLLDDRSRRYASRPDLTLETTDDEHAALLEAIALKSDIEARKSHLKAIDYQAFRGFQVTLVENDLELALGRAPFGVKLDKLEGILQKLQEKGEVAARIELDYQGKAFVKTKKM